MNFAAFIVCLELNYYTRLEERFKGGDGGSGKDKELTHANTIIELIGHLKRLIGGGITGNHEWTVMSRDIGDIGVIAHAELAVAIARRGVGLSRGRTGGGVGSCRVHSTVAMQCGGCPTTHQYRHGV